MNRGFSLIELVVTVAIMSVLTSVALPMGEVLSRRTKEFELRHALRDIRNALDAYKRAGDAGKLVLQSGKSGYPPTLKALVAGVADVTSPDKSRMMYFLRKIPRDPFVTDASKSDDETWGKRCYGSSDDAPQEGDDVFDVYSTTDGAGLNGITYRQW